MTPIPTKPKKEVIKELINHAIHLYVEKVVMNELKRGLR